MYVVIRVNSFAIFFDYFTLHYICAPEYTFSVLCPLSPLTLPPTLSHTHTFAREAIEHFLTALNMQQQADAPPGTTSTMSESIWSTLRLAVSMHGRPDLLHLIEGRDLSELMREFGMNR